MAHWGRFHRALTKAALGTALLTGALTYAEVADAFCGFYVAGADAKLFNNATLVVMMRDGTKTVLSMQNNYQGPPENFAMVVPVPVVLQKENVKTLDDAIFDRVDKLAAPRLVEYWERDPCAPPDPPMMPRSMAMKSTEDSAAPGGSGVKIEAQFEVGEYDIVILSASDSTGLDKWLKSNGYNIPQGAEPVLRPYVEEGSKFFVAKVNIDKVTFENGQAMLSPLRVDYDTDKFALPVRSGSSTARTSRISSSTSSPSPASTSPITPTSPFRRTSISTSRPRANSGASTPSSSIARSTRTPRRWSPNTPGTREPAIPAPHPRSISRRS